MIDLTEEQIERYSRHILLQDVGPEGQEKLLNAKVLIIGAGGLGSPVASTSLRLAWDISVSWMPMWLTSATCNDRSSTRPRT